MFSLDEILQIFIVPVLAAARRGQASSALSPKGGTTSGGPVSDGRLEGRQQANGSGNGHGGAGHQGSRHGGAGSAAEQAARRSEEWGASPRWRSVRRTYS